MSNLAWMFIAFMTVWVAIVIYTMSLGARQKAVEAELEDYRNRI